MKHEETTILPWLEKNCDEDKINSINDWFMRTKAAAPTRPHPDGPKSAVGLLASGNQEALESSYRDEEP